MSLAESRCEPCRGGIPPLGADEAQKLSAETPNWTLNAEATRMTREFTLKDFKEALAFVNKVGALAEAEGHHPDFTIHYKRVELILWTHKIGGLHRNDFVMAAKIDQLAS